MKFEVRCPSCGRGYLVDPAKVPAQGGVIHCQKCGATIPVSSPEPPAPAPIPPQAPAAEVVCPRCGLHFVPAAARPAAGGGQRRVVLVVEDMDYFLEIATDALRGKYEVRTAKTVGEAVRQLRAGGIDAVLLDLNLEHGEDGLEILRLHPKACPVIAFTAQDEEEMYGEGWERLQALGVDDIVRKGMHMTETLQRKVGAALGEPESESPPGR